MSIRRENARSNYEEKPSVEKGLDILTWAVPGSGSVGEAAGSPGGQDALTLMNCTAVLGTQPFAQSWSYSNDVLAQDSVACL